MSNRVVNIDPFNPMSVAKAQRIYYEEWRDFNRKVDDFLLEVASLGQRYAEMLYGGAPVTVTLESIGGGYAVVANGDKIGIFEFGAGDSAQANDFAEQVPYAVAPGSWSEIHSKGRFHPNYAEDRYWEFGGMRYTAIKGHHAMQGAWDIIQEEWRAIAERVFS